MTSHKTGTMSESEEMYLITIARFAEEAGDRPAPLSWLAQELGVQPVSVNQMVRKLADEGLVHYFPYKGVELTGAGQHAALGMLRYRRLWEVFLVDHLHLAPAEADALACRMEHITSDDLAARLARFLGDPVASPQGRPIPRLDAPETAAWLPLRHVKTGLRARVMHVDGDAAVRSFLGGAGVGPGVDVTILAVGADGSILVAVGDHAVHLSGHAADAVAVGEVRAPEGHKAAIQLEGEEDLDAWQMFCAHCAVYQAGHEPV